MVGGLRFQSCFTSFILVSAFWRSAGGVSGSSWWNYAAWWCVFLPGCVKDACDAITTFNPKLEKPVTKALVWGSPRLLPYTFMRSTNAGIGHAYSMEAGRPPAWPLTVVFDSVVHELKHNKMVMFANILILQFRDVTLFQHLIKRGRDLHPGIAYGDIWRASVFFSSALTHARIMVGWVGEPKGSRFPYAPVVQTLFSPPPARFDLRWWKLSIAYGGCHHGYSPTSPFLKIEIVNGKAVIFSLQLPATSSACTRTSLTKSSIWMLAWIFYPQFHSGYLSHLWWSLRGYYITLDGLMMLQLGLSCAQCGTTRAVLMHSMKLKPSGTFRFPSSSTGGAPMIRYLILILHFWNVTLSLHLIKRVPDWRPEIRTCA